MPRIGWIKLYRFMLDDEDVDALDAGVFRTWITYLLLASHSRQPGVILNGEGNGMSLRDRAKELNLGAATMHRHDEVLMGRGLIKKDRQGNVCIANWGSYQTGQANVRSLSSVDAQSLSPAEHSESSVAINGADCSLSSVQEQKSGLYKEALNSTSRCNRVPKKRKNDRKNVIHEPSAQTREAKKEQNHGIVGVWIDTHREVLGTDCVVSGQVTGLIAQLRKKFGDEDLTAAIKCWFGDSRNQWCNWGISQFYQQAGVVIARSKGKVQSDGRTRHYNIRDYL